jgi:multidrug efflux pump subunit AcrB
MVKFLINRPIALIMSFLAILFLGLITVVKIPVSLMPDIDIPEITVQVVYPDIPAREVENTVLSKIRQQLLQVGHLDEIESESRDGSGVIRLKFNYGTDINYAYIETNEKIDDAMSSIPKDVDRPRVIKASATDIPVFNILVNRKANWQNEERFLEMSEFVRSVIIKRIEQLPEVAMVDQTGMSYPELAIYPDYEKLNSLGITTEELISSLKSNNISSIGNVMVREGHYQFSVQFKNYLKDLEDIGEIYIERQNRLFQLKDLARLELRTEKKIGMFHNREKQAICLSVIKQADARMEDMRLEISDLLDDFSVKYPELEFEIEKDQTSILRTSIGNLKQSLLFGAFLAIFIMFLFLKDFRSPLLIGISIPVSLVICFLIFYLAGISINIISLSGLILAVGMMIDNSIIVIDNIDQYIRKDHSLDDSCITGTNEVIRPLISSALTTSAVFIPLIFLSGISGALFFDQALAVTIGLIVSLLVSITLLPMLYRLLNLRRSGIRENRFLARVNKINYERAYEKGFEHVFRFKEIYIVLFLSMLGLAYLLSQWIDIRRLPVIEQTELVAAIDWNEPIHVDENSSRTQALFTYLSDSVLQYSVLTGEQQFILNQTDKKGITECEVYIMASSSESIRRIEEEIKTFMQLNHSLATIEFSPPKNVFEALFADHSPDLVARIRDLKSESVPMVEEVNTLIAELDLPETVNLESIPLLDQVVIGIDPELLLLYQIDFNALQLGLRSAFNENQVDMLKTYQRFIPITIGDDPKTILEIIDQTLVRNKAGQEIPLASLVSLSREQTYKTIKGGRDGEYIPLNIRGTDPGLEESIQVINDKVKKDATLDLTFAGRFFTQKDMIRELLLVLLVSVLLLYFILAAQFESFVQPVIVLLELPIDIAGALFMLWLFGETLNLMSAIGIIVMSGIIINDSILKIDTINRARWSGMDTLSAIKLGGQRRLKPIIMTSLTTILALVPFLFFSGLGAELQKPLALAVIGGMTLGTLVSLYFIPLAYWILYRPPGRLIPNRSLNSF